MKNTIKIFTLVLVLIFGMSAFVYGAPSKDKGPDKTFIHAGGSQQTIGKYFNYDGKLFELQGSTYQSNYIEEELEGRELTIAAEKGTFIIVLTAHGNGNDEDTEHATDNYWIESIKDVTPVDPPIDPPTDPETPEPPVVDPPTDPETPDPPVVDPPIEPPVVDPPVVDPPVVDPPTEPPVVEPPVVEPEDNEEVVKDSLEYDDAEPKTGDVGLSLLFMILCLMSGFAILAVGVKKR